jgi:hypothetical protein
MLNNKKSQAKEVMERSGEYEDEDEEQRMCTLLMMANAEARQSTE